MKGLISMNTVLHDPKSKMIFAKECSEQASKERAQANLLLDKIHSVFFTALLTIAFVAVVGAAVLPSVVAITAESALYAGVIGCCMILYLLVERSSLQNERSTCLQGARLLEGYAEKARVRGSMQAASQE